jgi:hypothetical protein
MTNMTDFFETFMVIYNVGAAFVLIFMIGNILVMMRKVDKQLLKARIFLNDSILQRTWIYISISGASFALYNLIKFVIRFTPKAEIFEVYQMPELIQLIFLISFIIAVHNWYGFIGSSITKNAT